MTAARTTGRGLAGAWRERFTARGRERFTARGHERATAPSGPTAPGRDLEPVGLDDLVRWDRPFFRDPALQAEVRRAGYVVGDRVLDDAELVQLRGIAAEFLDRLDGPCGEEFLTIGRIQDPVLREDITRRAGALVTPRLAPYFHDDTEQLGAALQVKPASPHSQLDPHQDSSLVDETTTPSVYAWIPLVDTDEHNGGLRVVPGSHRFGNCQRTLNVPWQLAPFVEVLRERSVPLEVPAGTVVFFDAATVHSSLPNHSGEVRMALNNFVKPAAAPLVHFFTDELTSPDMVEVFEIDVDFFLRADIMVRPETPYVALGERPAVRLDWSRDDFVRRCDRALIEAGGVR